MNDRVLGVILFLIGLIYLISPIDLIPGALLDDIVVCVGLYLAGKKHKQIDG